MTNILDTEGPDLFKFKDGRDVYYHIQDSKGESVDSFYSRETVESLLAEHRNQVLLEAAEICDGLHYKWRWDNEPDSDSGPRDCRDELRRMANGEK